jgi:hypothetical protein
MDRFPRTTIIDIRSYNRGLCKPAMLLKNSAVAGVRFCSENMATKRAMSDRGPQGRRDYNTLATAEFLSILPLRKCHCLRSMRFK